MKDHFAQRREKLRKKIRNQNLNAYLVLHPANRFYLSGFELQDPQYNESAGCLLITAQGNDWLCTDPRYFETAKNIWQEDKIFIYKQDRAQRLSEFFTQTGIQYLGFETKIMSHELFAKLNQDIHLVPYRGLVEELRIIKDEYEIELLQNSCNLSHQIFAQLENQLLPGKSEKELAWDVEKYYRENGASDVSFRPIVASGTNSAQPHHTPKETIIEKNSPLLIDCGGRLDDYCSDQTRTFWLDKNPPSYFQETLDIVQQAQKTAIDYIQPGVNIKDLFSKVYEFFCKHKVQQYFTHALGHGIGLETHEAPSLGPNQEGELMAGMVVTIEPGLYFPKWGGIRWEHMIVVTEEGVRIL